MENFNGPFKSHFFHKYINMQTNLTSLPVMIEMESLPCASVVYTSIVTPQKRRLFTYYVCHGHFANIEPILVGYSVKSANLHTAVPHSLEKRVGQWLGPLIIITKIPCLSQQKTSLQKSCRLGYCYSFHSLGY